MIFVQEQRDPSVPNDLVEQFAEQRDSGVQAPFLTKTVPAYSQKDAPHLFLLEQITLYLYQQQRALQRLLPPTLAVSADRGAALRRLTADLSAALASEAYVTMVRRLPHKHAVETHSHIERTRHCLASVALAAATGEETHLSLRERLIAGTREHFHWLWNQTWELAMDAPGSGLCLSPDGKSCFWSGCYLSMYQKERQVLGLLAGYAVTNPGEFYPHANLINVVWPGSLQKGISVKAAGERVYPLIARINKALKSVGCPCQIQPAPGVGYRYFGEPNSRGLADPST